MELQSLNGLSFPLTNQHDLKGLQIACMALIKERTRLLNRSKTQSLALWSAPTEVVHQLG